MTDHQAPQPGAEPTSAGTAQMEAQQPRPPQVRPAQQGPRARSGYAAAFGDGSGAAWVLRDLASI